MNNGILVTPSPTSINWDANLMLCKEETLAVPFEENEPQNVIFTAQKEHIRDSDCGDERTFSSYFPTMAPFLIGKISKEKSAPIL